MDGLTSPVYEGPSFPSCLLCYLCGQLFRRPRILPCGHTFCSECLANIRDEIIANDTSSVSVAPSSLSTNLDSINSQSVPDVQNRSSVLSPDSYERNGNGIHFSNGGRGNNAATNNKEVNFNYSDLGLYGSEVDYLDHNDNGQFSKAAYNGNDHNDDATNTVTLRHTLPNHTLSRRLMTRSDTYTVGQRQSKSVDRAPSRPTCHSEPSPSQQCSQCGHKTPSRPRCYSSATRSSSVKERAKTQPCLVIPSSSSCVAAVVRRWDSSPQRKTVSALSAPACSFDQKHEKEMGPFVCPMPDCNYTMRVMNLSRWSHKNKALADAVAAWRLMNKGTSDATTQTDISHNQSVLVTIPRVLVSDTTLEPISHRKRHSSMQDIAFDHAISVDGLQRGYLPRGHFSWRSYAAMVGMNILHQIVNL